MLARDARTHKFQVLLALLTLVSALLFASPLQAQTFQSIPALAFTKAFAGAEPLPQVLTIAYTDQTTVRFSTSASTNSGGSWLSVSPAGAPCCYTPYPVSVIVTAGNLAAGTYTGQVVITNYANGAIKMTIPVTLTVAASGATFFDDLPGKLSYSFKTSGTPVPQSIQIQNAGTGTLNWTLTKSTADGGSWLSASASGTAPSTISVSITKAGLPGGGAVAGTYVGQLLLQGSGDSVTIPVAVTVGTAVFTQVNPLNFTMAFGGANTLPQIVNIAMTDNSVVRYSTAVATAKGGNWLSISPSGTPCCYTPSANTVSVNAGSLAAGTYTGEVLITEYANPARSMTVPVTLTVLSSGAFFADLPGQLSFSLKTNGSKITSQTVQVGNGGSGTLNWTVATSTADGGNWLTATPASGAAPSAVSVGVTVSQLPGGGAVAGEYLGQVVLQTSGDTTTIPITVTVGPSAFTQLNPLSFTMPFGGANPLPQVVNMAAVDGSTIRYSAAAVSAKGGNWLSVSPSGAPCCYTPLAMAVSVNASTLAAGTYTGEIIFNEWANPARSLVLPVSLTVVASGPFFDNLPGGLSFSFKTGGTATPQIVQVGNGGSTGTLNWTVTSSTADGGAWLAATPPSGTAPSIATVTVTAANLPGAGALPGTFSGQLVFQTAGDSTTIPVTVTVGDAVFTQVNQISFTMPFGGANPLPQVLNIASTDGSAIRFSANASTAKGPGWLTISPSGSPCCYTPLAVTASVNASTLPAGTYTGEIIITEWANPGRSMTIPVTLTIASSGAFFDSLPGGLSFSVQPGKKATSQTLLVGNGGTGKLKFTVTPTTADGGLWLTTTPVTTSTPKLITVAVNVLKLPGGGQIAGTYTGQLLLQGTGTIATVPVTVTVGNAVFTQVNPISFVMPFGGASPLPQILTIPATDNSAIRFSANAATSKGGNWLTISPAGSPCCYTSLPIKVSINGSSLAAGNYTGEISIVEWANPGRSMTVPVNLVVLASSKAFFDNVPGQTSFSFQPTKTNPPSQTIVVGNGGGGTLNWTVAATTGDPGKWIKVLPTKGVDAGTYTVSVTNSKLPGKGLIAGTYVGQQVLKTKTGNVTIPVVVTVGDPVFVQLPTVTFNTTRGSNPANQVISIASTSASIRYSLNFASAKGGNWLSVTPSGNPCCFTPTSETVSANASALPVGTYTGEIIITEWANPGKSMTVPVVLNVAP